MVVTPLLRRASRNSKAREGAVADQHEVAPRQRAPHLQVHLPSDIEQGFVPMASFPVRLTQMGPPQTDAATVSATFALRVPSGSGLPVVVSLAVWCSISAFNSAPSSTMVVEIQIQVMKPMTAPSEP